jgi:hypothetical protein
MVGYQTKKLKITYVHKSFLQKNSLHYGGELSLKYNIEKKKNKTTYIEDKVSYK